MQGQFNERFMASQADKRYRRRMVISYWIRILICPSFSVDDVAKVMVEYGDDYEVFNPEISSKDIGFSKDNLTIYKDGGFGKSAFGTIDVISGGKYHWKLKLIEDSPFANIGLIKAGKCIKEGQGCWLNGFSYHQTGSINVFTNTYKTVSRGNPFKKNDIVEMKLDLKDGNVMSYILNGKELAKISCDHIKDNGYKLAVGFHEKGKVTLLSFKQQ